jgi:adenosylmethionine-8-amino-7-oxononanoate aminotransferase
MNNNLAFSDREFIWHPYSSLVDQPDNLVVKSGDGVYLTLEDGRKIIDAIASWWVNIHGHAHPYIIKKLVEQAAQLEHVIFAGFTHEPAIRLAERLLEILPGQQKKIFFSDNGSTAVEIAIKMAIQYKHNKGNPSGKIVALEGSFHGDTFGAMAVSERGIFTNHFSKYLFDVEYIPFPDKENEVLTVEIFEKKILNNVITAFIYEPLVQGAAGMRIYASDLLEKLLSIAKKHQVVCIADEVMTGFGRTGKLFASEYQQTAPDIICLSKGITGGFLPFGATACNAEIESAFKISGKDKILFHGHSFTGNPLACAVSNASLDLLLTQAYRDKIEFINKSHIAFLTKINGHKAIKRAAVLGTLISIEINTSDTSGYLNSIRDDLYNFFLNRNILMRPLGNVIYVLPPYIIEEKELNLIYEAVLDLLKNRSN